MTLALETNLHSCTFTTSPSPLLFRSGESVPGVHRTRRCQPSFPTETDPDSRRRRRRCATAGREHTHTQPGHSSVNSLHKGQWCVFFGLFFASFSCSFESKPRSCDSLQMSMWWSLLWRLSYVLHVLLPPLTSPVAVSQIISCHLKHGSTTDTHGASPLVPA